jgi:lipoprotein-anchoring transpeptidase ErfK/SrfK
MIRKILPMAFIFAVATTAHAEIQPTPQQQVQKCTSFLKCLFTPRRHRAQNAAFGAYQNQGLSGATNHSEVTWTDTKYPAGAIVIKTPERALYFIEGNGKATRYAVGVGREGFQWGGVSTIVSKAEWPGWTPPKVMIDREAAKGHFIPAHMDGGPGNPLGARAMYLGGRMYRIHGTNNEASIGGAVSSGCIRMMNADVIELYERVKVGAKVYVQQ